MSGTSGALLAALGLSFILSLFESGKYALYPFKLFTTWVHECSHAVTAALLGGQVSRITLSPDTSGLVHYRLPAGRLRQGAVTSMGYLGASLAGCVIFYLSHLSPLVLARVCQGLGLLLWLSAAVWVRGSFGIVVTLALGALFAGLGFDLGTPHAWPRGWPSLPPAWPGRIRQFFVPWLAIQTALHSLFDLKTLFGLAARARSDARTMSRLFLLPAYFWAALWLALSIGFMAETLRLAHYF